MAALDKGHSLSQTAAASPSNGSRKTSAVYSKHLDKTVRVHPSQIVYGKEPVQLPDGVINMK